MGIAAGNDLPPIPQWALSSTVDWWANAIALGIAVATGLYCVWRSKTERSPLALVIFLGSLLTPFIEPFLDMLGNVAFPQEGTTPGITMMGRYNPLYIGIINVCTWPGALLFVVDAIRDGASMKKWFAIAGSIAGISLIWEQIPMSYEMWSYYGAQPFRVGEFPLWWAFINGHCLMATGLAVFLLQRVLQGRQIFLLVPILPPLIVGCHALGALPGYAGVATSLDYSVTIPATLAAMLLCTVLIWIYGRAIPLLQKAA